MMQLMLQKVGVLLSPLPVMINLDLEQTIPYSSPTTPHQVTAHLAMSIVMVTTTTGILLQLDMVNMVLVTAMVIMPQVTFALPAGTYQKVLTKPTKSIMSSGH